MPSEKLGDEVTYPVRLVAWWLVVLVITTAGALVLLGVVP